MASTVSLPIDFENDIREAVLQRLPHKPAQTANLRAMSAADLLVAYINWRSRLIPAQPREVCQSWEFTANPLRWDPAYRPAIDHIVDALKTGGDLTAHLSTRIESGFGVSGPTDFGHRTDLDLLLNDWSVHHLHLSTVKRPDGFVERTGPLLFAIVGSKQAFLIDILDHRSWTHERIAHVMIDNWPNANFVHHVASIVSVHVASDAERKIRRDAGIHTGFIERKGKYYMVGMGGLSSAGTNVQHARLANLIRQGLRAFEEGLKEQPDYVAETLRLNNIPLPPTLDLHFIIRNDGWFAIREENTRTLFPIPGLPQEQP
jgi:hypothetical protein